jgi:hypothetical protein
MSAQKPQVAKENRRNVRVDLPRPLRVVMGSIGSEMRYELQTSNISVNGFFLAFDSPGRFPFTPASIMEVWMELEKGNTIFFNGKMARVVYSDDASAKESGPGIAVKIVQIDAQNDKILRDFVAKIYQNFSPASEHTGVSPKVA